MMHDAYHHKIFILKTLLYLDKRDNNIIQIVFTFFYSAVFSYERTRSYFFNIFLTKLFSKKLSPLLFNLLF